MNRAFRFLLLTVLFRSGASHGQLGDFIQLATLEITANSILVSGTTLFTMGDGLSIYDVENPALPIRLGRLKATGAILGSNRPGTILYLSDEILDVSDPRRPRSLAVYPNGMEVDVATGSLAYATIRNATIQFIDLSRPEVPILAAAYGHPVPSGPRFVGIKGVAGDDTFAVFAWYQVYVSPYGGSTSGFSEFITLDVTDPWNPTLIARATGYQSAQLEVTGVAGCFLMFRYVDIGSFRTFPGLWPVRIEFISPFGTPIVAAGSPSFFLYNEPSARGVRVVDLSDLRNPVDIAEPIPGFARDIEVSKDIVFLARETYLEILRFEGSPAPLPTLANPHSDIDRSNRVDAKDLLILLSDWKKVTHP